MAESTGRQIDVRRVTDVHANWSEQGSGEEGKFSFQLVLDNGAVEYVVRQTAEDAKVFAKLLKKSESVHFDLSHGVTVFNGTRHG